MHFTPTKHCHPLLYPGNIAHLHRSHPRYTPLLSPILEEPPTIVVASPPSCLRLHVYRVLVPGSPLIGSLPLSEVQLVREFLQAWYLMYC